MLIGVISDTHDRLPMIDAALALFARNRVEAIIHSGDFVAPFAVKRLLEVCVASSRYQSALVYAQNYLADHPDDWSLRFLSATLEQALGNLDAARSELDRVIAEQPTHAPAYYALAMLLSEGFGEPEAAIERYEQYLRLAPNGEHAVQVRAWLSTYRRNHPPAKGVTP